MTLRRHAGRGLFAVTAAAVAIGFGATTALATTTTLTVKVSSGGTIHASSSNTVLTDNGISVKCTSSKGTASVPSGTHTGSSPVTIGSVTALSFSGCTGPTGAVTVTVSKLPYKLQIDSKTVSGKTDGIVSGVSTHLSSTGCSFNVTGSAPGYWNNSNHTLNMTPSLPTKPLNSASLTISSVSGCLGIIHNGDHPTYKATYTTGSKLTITSS